MGPFTASLAIVAAIYGWILLIRWAGAQDRRQIRPPEWMRLLDAELERALRMELHPSSLAKGEGGGAA